MTQLRSRKSETDSRIGLAELCPIAKETLRNGLLRSTPPLGCVSKKMADLPVTTMCGLRQIGAHGVRLPKNRSVPKDGVRLLRKKSRSPRGERLSGSVCRND